MRFEKTNQARPAEAAARRRLAQGPRAFSAASRRPYGRTSAAQGNPYNCVLGRIAIAALSLMLAAGRAEVLDRIAVTVDDRVITLSDLLREIRIAAFLDGVPPEFTAERKRAAERLIEQLLLQRDMELTRFPAPSPAEVERFLSQVRKSRAPEEAAWRTELERYGLSEAALREHLTARLAVLHYVEFRFRPEVQLSEGEIEQYLRDRGLGAGRGRAAGADPAAEQARQAAEAALAEERVNQLVDRWLKDARQRARIRYREAAFR